MGDNKAPPSLANMPNELLKVIAEQAGYMSIQRLRLVNHDFQDFIDDSKLEYYLNEISIQLQLNHVALKLKQGKESVKIVYKKHEEGTEVQIGYPPKVVKEMNFLDVFIEVLGDIFKKQVPTLDKLNIELISEQSMDGQMDQLLDANNKFMEKLLEVELPEGHEQWRTAMICVAGSHAHTDGILSMTNPNSLNRIEFFCNFDRFEREKSEAMTELEQWKSAKELYCLTRSCDPFERLDPTKFSHFEKMEINIYSMTEDGLDQLVKSYIENPNFKSSIILYNHYRSNDPVADYHREERERRRGNQSEEEEELYYRIPYSDYALFHFFSRKRSRFARIPLSRVPPNVELKNAENL